MTICGLFTFSLILMLTGLLNILTTPTTQPKPLKPKRPSTFEKQMAAFVDKYKWHIAVITAMMVIISNLIMAWAYLTLAQAGILG